MEASAVRKRERENPCGICGHYHKYEEGEVCGVCGHKIASPVERPLSQGSAFPSEILKDFLFLGSYDNASRGELLKTLGISRILNTVPSCQNLYKNSFTYHCLKDVKGLQFDDAIQLLEQCEKDKARVLVHCMSGKSRSPAIVIAYLMKSRGWRLAQSFQWVKDRRTQVELSEDARQRLMEFEQKLFGFNEPVSAPVSPPPDSTPVFGFGLQRTTSAASPIPVFRQPTTTSIFERLGPNLSSANNFVFSAGRAEEHGNEAPMDST